MNRSKFDKAMLVFYTPVGLCIGEWDGSKGYGTNGDKSRSTFGPGGNIAFNAASHMSWPDALDLMMETKIMRSSRKFSKISFDDPLYADLFSYRSETAKLYEGVPLSGLTAKLRGTILENVVRRYDERIYGTQNPDRERTYDGQRWRCPSVDWVRTNGSRIEAKSSQLKYSHNRWRFAFVGVKRGAFDHCILACHTPYGIYIGEWDGTRYCRVGRWSDTGGGHIIVYGPRGHTWQSSLEHILRERFPGRIRAFLPWQME